MSNKKTLTESLSEDAGLVEQDHEVQMARADCFYSAQHAIKLHKILGGLGSNANIPGWVQEKISLAADYLKSVSEYMEHELAHPAEPTLPIAETSDYARRRQREEDVISGKKPARKRTPTTNDYANRRAKEKKAEVSEGLLSNIFGASKDKAAAAKAEKLKQEFMQRKMATKNAEPLRFAGDYKWNDTHQDVKLKRGAVTEDNMDNPVVNAITRRIMLTRHDLLKKYGPEYVMQAIDDVADSVGELGPDDEIGSSDVSAWVRQVESNLKNRLNQYDEPMRDIDAMETASAGASGVGGVATTSSGMGMQRRKLKELDVMPVKPGQSAGDVAKTQIADKLKKSGNTQLATKLKSGTGTYNKDELDAIVGAKTSSGITK